MSAQNDDSDDIPLTAGAGFAVPGPSGSRRLRIMHVLFSSKLAGSERYCIDLANGQAALGHEVHVVGIHGAPLAAQLSLAVRFHGLRLPLFRGLRLARLVAATDAEICHAHLSPACKALAAIKGKVAKIATLHVGFKARQHARLDGVICVNKAQFARLPAFAGEARLISNWLPAREPGAPFGLRQHLRIAPQAFVIGAVGRLHPSKGYDVLIEAFRRTAPADAALVVIGEGPHRTALEKLSAGDPRIHLIGHRDNVSGFLRDIDLFVSPSREESFGLAILEAMQEGLPIIATAAEGPAEYLSSHPVALVEPGSTDAMTAALARLFEQGAVPGAGRIEYDLKPFSRATGICKVVAFYGALIGDAGGHAPRSPAGAGLLFENAA